VAVCNRNPPPARLNESTSAPDQSRAVPSWEYQTQRSPAPGASTNEVAFRSENENPAPGPPLWISLPCTCRERCGASLMPMPTLPPPGSRESAEPTASTPNTGMVGPSRLRSRPPPGRGWSSAAGTSPMASGGPDEEFGRRSSNRPVGPPHPRRPPVDSVVTAPAASSPTAARMTWDPSAGTSAAPSSRTHGACTRTGVLASCPSSTSRQVSVRTRSPVRPVVSRTTPPAPTATVGTLTIWPGSTLGSVTTKPPTATVIRCPVLSSAEPGLIVSPVPPDVALTSRPSATPGVCRLDARICAAGSR
jgi:hypothetical protein